YWTTERTTLYNKMVDLKYKLFPAKKTQVKEEKTPLPTIIDEKTYGKEEVVTPRPEKTPEKPPAPPAPPKPTIIDESTSEKPVEETKVEPAKEEKPPAPPAPPEASPGGKEEAIKLPEPQKPKIPKITSRSVKLGKPKKEDTVAIAPKQKPVTNSYARLSYSFMSIYTIAYNKMAAAYQDGRLGSAQIRSWLDRAEPLLEDIKRTIEYKNGDKEAKVAARDLGSAIHNMKIWLKNPGQI
ncbi:MAG: hypothetical protein ABIH00_00625, partial [Armatimonadota bacterium]